MLDVDQSMIPLFSHMLLALQESGEAIIVILVILFYVVFMGGIALVTIAGLVLWIWMIIDCAQNEPKRADTNTVVWILVLVLAGWIGALIYYFVRYKVPIVQQPMVGYPPQKPLY